MTRFYNLGDDAPHDSRLSIRRAAAILAAAFCLTGTAACSTPAKPAGVLSDYARLGEVKGRFGKRVEAAPVQALAPDSPLIIEVIDYAPGVREAAGLAQTSEGLLLNHFSRRLCIDLSPAFAVAEAGAANPQAYRLRGWITEVRPTSPVSSALSAPIRFFSPVGGRLPIGMGALAAEMEIIGPDGAQVAGMVWRRQANVMDESSVSRIADAYVLTEEAADAFAKLFQQASGNRLKDGVRALSPIPFASKADPACDRFGSPDRALSVVSSFLLPEIPPEMRDRGASPAKLEPAPEPAHGPEAEPRSIDSAPAPPAA